MKINVVHFIIWIFNINKPEYIVDKYMVPILLFNMKLLWMYYGDKVLIILSNTLNCIVSL